jgi:thiamine biosynthesis lipoprotein ApbE
VALQVPGGAPGQFVEKKKMKDRAVSTSGNYEQGAHILDPVSGQRVQRSGGVTVIATDLTTADALATAFFVLGKEGTAIFLKKISDVEVIWLNPLDHLP